MHHYHQPSIGPSTPIQTHPSTQPPTHPSTQKVATAGLTRFEDRHRLPLGISCNFTSFAAKVGGLGC